MKLQAQHSELFWTPDDDRQSHLLVCQRCGRMEKAPLGFQKHCAPCKSTTGRQLWMSPFARVAASHAAHTPPYRATASATDPLKSDSLAVLTIAELAVAVGVSRRTVERAIESGAIVPASTRPSGRPRFSRQQAAELAKRAEQSREKGYRSVMFDVVTPGRPRRPRKDPPLSSQEFIRRLVWKHQNLPRRTVKTREP